MVQKLKRAFTITELVIVIAVVAILAAVLIPTFANIINKANESADLQTVKNLNTILASEQTVADAPAATMSEALAQAQEGGYVVDKLSPTGENNDILWEQNSNRFVLADKNGNILYKDNITEGGTAQGGNFWKITGDEDAVKAENNAKGFSYYLKESFSAMTFTAAAGIDVGENDEAFTITYSNTGEAAAQPVVFNTNESFALTVNAPKDTVHHYGKAGSITVQAVAGNSYHEYGEVTSLTINSGRLVIGGGVHAPEVIVEPAENASVKLEISGGAEVDLLTVKGTSENVAITNDGTIGTYTGGVEIDGTAPSGNVTFRVAEVDGLTSLVEVTGELPAVLTIPSQINGQTIEAIGGESNKSVFGNARDVETVILPNTLKKINGRAFSNAYISEIVIPNGVKTIESFAFSFNMRLTDIVIPDSVTSLGSSVFSMCMYMESAVIGDGLTEIPEGTFSNCSNLKTVEIGANVQTFDSNIVSYAENINVDANNTHYQSVSGCLLETGTDGSSLTVVWAGENFTEIPGIATAIGDNAFMGKTGITGALVIPNSVVTIGENAFSGCTGITSIVLGDGVVKIGNNAFKDCSNVQSLHIGKSVQNLVDLSDSNGDDYNANAFYGLTSLTEITVSDGANYTVQDNCVLSKDDSTTLVLGCKTSVIPDTVTKIGGYAFTGKGLVSLPSLKNITEVGENAFDHNESVSGGVLDLRNVTSIGVSAFQFCGTVDSVIVSKNITSLAVSAFANITIGSVYFCGNAEEWAAFVEKFDKGVNNEGLLHHQNVIYYSADGTKPDSEHTYWKYNENGLPEIIQ